MRMKEFVDQKGNLIFEINSKKIIISISKLRYLMGTGILSVFGSVKSLSSRIFDDGVVFIKENKKEGYIRLNLRRIVNPRDKNLVIQKKIIETLSHEARHIFQVQSKGELLELFKELDITLSFLLVIISILSFIAMIVVCIVGFKIPIYIYILLIFSPTFFIFLQISYFLNPEERDARKFAWEAIKDKRWLEIVQVKRI
jgi:hypothetical protein